MHYVEIEFACDDEATMLNEIAEYAKRFNCSHEIVKEENEFSGWPVVRFSSEKMDDIINLCKDYFDEDDDYDYYIDTPWEE